MALSPNLARVRMSTFMFALFEKCEQVIITAMETQGGNPKIWLRDNGATWFREKMSEGQTMHAQGEYRVAFYDDVVKRAEEVSSYQLWLSYLYAELLRQLYDDAYIGLKARSPSAVTDKGTSPEPIRFRGPSELIYILRAISPSDEPPCALQRILQS